MRRALIRLSVLLIAASAVVAQTNTWRQYNNANGNFSVSLPVEPTETDMASGNSQIVSSRYIQAKSDGVSYSIIYVNLRDAQEVSEQNLQAYKEGFMKQLSGCSIASELPPSPAVSGYVGHLYRMDCNISGTRMNFAGNIYWGKHFSYAVLGMFATAPANPPAIKKFLDSFTVTDSTK